LSALLANHCPSASAEADLRAPRPGSGDNLLIRSTFHLTINANGDVTVGDTTFEELCVG
jgi:hypothetical protein